MVEWAPRWRSEKIQSRHLERLAVVYVRQSTVRQVLDHQESTRLQYGRRAAPLPPDDGGVADLARTLDMPGTTRLRL